MYVYSTDVQLFCAGILNITTKKKKKNKNKKSLLLSLGLIIKNA